MSNPRVDKVDANKCVWCKKEPTDGVGSVTLETGEMICQPCLGDCRQWNRAVQFQVITSTNFPDDVGDKISKAAYEPGIEMMDELGYLGTDRGKKTSNAESGYVAHD